MIKREKRKTTLLKHQQIELMIGKTNIDEQKIVIYFKYFKYDS